MPPAFIKNHLGCLWLKLRLFFVDRRGVFFPVFPGIATLRLAALLLSISVILVFFCISLIN